MKNKLSTLMPNRDSSEIIRSNSYTLLSIMLVQSRLFPDTWIREEHLIRSFIDHV